MQILISEQSIAKVTLFATDPSQIVELKWQGDEPDLRHCVSCLGTLLIFLLGMQAHGGQDVGFIRPEDLMEVKEPNPYQLTSKDAITRLVT